MKSLINTVVGLSFLIIIFIVPSCKKSIFLDDRNEKIPVVINLSGFTAIQKPLIGAVPLSSKLGSSQVASSQVYHEGNLYFWSFNNDNLEPDVKYQVATAATISYNGNRIPSSFVNSTYSYEGYAAGRALTITGPTELIITFPIKQVNSLKSFGFDIGSSNTGPKTFDLFYSIDNGTSYHLLVENNQFSSFAANAKHSYVYPLEMLQLPADNIQLKFVFRAGERGSSSDYNATSGSIRLDNVYLRGISPIASVTHTVNKLHYFFFNKSSNKLTSGDEVFEGQGNLNLELEYGEYDFFIVTNNSLEELIIPAEFTKNTLTLSNYFRNGKAEIYGYVGQLMVDKPLTTQVVLGRLFSQIKIEFTDPGSLSHIQRVVIRQSHKPFQYSPFISSSQSNFQDQTTLEFTDNIDSNKQILFHQFMGALAEAKALFYSVEVYTAEGLIRTFDLASTLRNNMQLVFRGHLLENTLTTGQFEIIRNETWGGQEALEF